MKHFFFIVGLCLAAFVQPAPILSQDWIPPFFWNLLWTSSWEENGNLHNRGDFRLGLARQGLTFRGQVLDRRPLELGTEWADFSERTSGGVSLGLYHRATGSRVLYGVLHEQGLPSRIRSPWSRSVPYAENRRPTQVDLRTVSSATRVPEAYLRLSSPRFALFEGGVLPEVSMRGFGSAQIAAQGNLWPAFSGGLETFIGASTVSLEGFFTGTKLEARKSSTWFANPPSLPDREFRLWAAALVIDTPHFLLASDLALSSTFAHGNGFYGNAAIRLRWPLSPWSLSFAAEGMGERYVGRNGISHGGGLRTAGRIERREPRGGLFRVDTSLRSPGLDAPFDRSSSSISYRFPTPSARAVNDGMFPLRISRVAFNLYRDASNPMRIQDRIDGTLGLSLNLPPMLLPAVLLPQQSRTARSRPRIYPLGISLSSTLRGRDSTDGVPLPYPFFSRDREFDSLSVGCELRWSPGILQFRTRWSYTEYAARDGNLYGSFSAAVRFGRGRFSARVAWLDFPERREYALSWRLEM